LEKKIHIITPSEVSSDANFGTFYSTYYERFVKYAFYYVSNHQSAEDLTHDAILYYWENRDKLPPDTDVLGYLMVTVKNKCLNYLKHLKVEADFNKQYAELYEWEVNARIMTLEDTHYSEIFTSDILDNFNKSLDKLPKKTRNIFVENRLNNKSRKEIAAEMGVSLQKIDYHINKAKDHLQKDLEDYLPAIAIFFGEIFF
jgi:RNA polymerase sigma-70 factor (ECF subfamily)